MLNTTSSTDISSILTNDIVITSKHVTIPLTLLAFILFPFYAYVNRVNRERDEQTAIFAFTNHFYYSVKCICFLILLSVSLGLLFYSYSYHRKVISLIVFFVLIFLIYIALNAITEVQYVLITLLALQRFFLYYIPSSERFVNLSQSTMKVIIGSLYVLFILKDAVAAVLTIWFHGVEIENENDTKLDQVLMCQGILYAFLNGLLILSACLYIPLTISIRRFSHLASFVQSQPQKYVFYQTISLVIGKIVFLPSYLTFFLHRDDKEIVSPLRVFLAYATIIDAFSMPIIIQLTYLSCNKRNIDVLRSYPIRDALKMTLCGGEVPERSNQVADVRVSSTRN